MSHGMFGAPHAHVLYFQTTTKRAQREREINSILP